MLGLASTIQKIYEGYPQYRSRNSCTFTVSSTDYITVAASSDFNVATSDYSFSGWVKLTVDASSVSNEDGYAIIDAGNSHTGSGDGNGFSFYYRDDAGDSQKFRLYHWAPSSSPNLPSLTNIVSDTWYHIVVTYNYIDGGDNVAKMYINGALDNTETDMVAPGDSSSTALLLGSSSSDTINSQQCEIIYWKGTVLSASQVAGLYNNGRPRHGLSCERDTIKAWWKLNADDTTGSGNVLDSSTSSHTGTTTGLGNSDFNTKDVPK